jgi:hypothetical protein
MSNTPRMSDEEFNRSLLGNLTPPLEGRYSSMPGQPNTREHIRTGRAEADRRAESLKPKDEPRSPDLTKQYKEAEMSRRRIEKERTPGLAALQFKQWAFRAMKIAGIAAMAYDTKFSYDVINITSQNRGFAIAISGLILFMNYGIISSLFLKTLDKVFGIDLADYKPTHNARGATGFINTFLNFIADNTGGIILLTLAVIAFGSDFATNYGGVSMNGIRNIPTPWPSEWTLTFLALFLIFGGGGLMHIADVNLEEIADKLPDIKHRANQTVLKQQMVDAELDDGVPKAQEAGWALGSKLADQIAATLQAGRVK